MHMWIEYRKNCVFIVQTGRLGLALLTKNSPGCTANWYQPGYRGVASGTARPN